MTGGRGAGIKKDMDRAIRLEWITIGAMATVLAVMTMALGGSEAFRTALFEDWLSLIPAIVFLLSAHFEGKRANARFPYGYHRANSLAFLVAAVALAGVGGLLLFESIMTLVKAEHPTIEPIRLFGHDIWSGWIMMGALLYSAVPPMILGRMKQPIAERLHDKVLHTDALMQRADWMTGLAGIVGILGVGFGYWWADASAATFIAAGIVRDGLRTLRIAAAELNDGTPRALDSDSIAPDAVLIRKALETRFPGSQALLRETGRYIRAEVVGAAAPKRFSADDLDIPGLEHRWRLESVSFQPKA